MQQDNHLSKAYVTWKLSLQIPDNKQYENILMTNIVKCFAKTPKCFSTVGK